MSTPTEDHDLNDSPTVSQPSAPELRLRALLSRDHSEFSAEYVQDALLAAAKLGFLVEVRLRPNAPLVMGNYQYEIDVRPIRPSCSIQPDSADEMPVVIRVPSPEHNVAP